MIGNSTINNEISLYFHIPFCTKKCHYCHFFVLPDHTHLRRQLLEALHLEIDLYSQELENKKLVSIYFGGGTPSLLEPEEIYSLIDHLHKYLAFDPYTLEITLEANPETITLERMKAFKNSGINRVSIGVQTLDDNLLIKLGRTHSSKTSLEAIYATAESGLENISIDLMYDIPYQTLHSWQQTLEAVSKLPITHLSLYNLTIEPNTLFFKIAESLRKELPDSDSSTEMYQLAKTTLELASLKQYEISAFAKNNLISIHNTGYWEGRPFLGLGPSAFSYWNGERFRATANLNKYSEALKQGKHSIDFTEALDEKRKRQELLAIALRMKKGVDIKAFEDRLGSLDSEAMLAIKMLCNQELLKLENNHLFLTDKGILFYDTVAMELI